MIRRLLPGIMALLFFSCSYNEPVNFWNARGTGSILYALSKNAGRGVLPLATEGKLEYRLSGLRNAQNEYALEISYSIQGGRENRSSIILESGDFSWELPQDFSFLNNPELTAIAESSAGTISYTVPLPYGLPEQINVICKPEDGKSAAKDISFNIKSIGLAMPWYGFSFNRENNSVRLSPFVYSENNSIYIDLPSPFYIKGDLQIRNTGSGRFTAEGAGPGQQGYFRIEGESRNGTFNIPAIFIAKTSYPVRISVTDVNTRTDADIRNITGAGIYEVSSAAGMDPVTADPGMILSWPQDAFRDPRYEVFRWESFPSILIFDFADYDIQDRFLKRLAFYAEKAGFRGRLAADREIAGLHGWNAHDYRAETLAAFYGLAEAENFPLLPEELELKKILLDAKIIVRNATGSLVPGEGAIISISRESEEYLRALFMAHEGYHGLYFIDQGFRDFCKQRWENLTQVPRSFILSYFDYQAYDIKDQDLVITEFMAHILQQPVSQAERYFGLTLAGRIDASSWRRTVLPEKDEASGTWPLLGTAFRLEAEAFSRYVNERWGLAAGRVSRVTVRL